jgi:hypothetical protein
MKRLLLAAIFYGALSVFGSAGMISRNADDRDFVRLGVNRGYYRVSSDSGKWWDWGLARAPVDEPTRFNHGNGTDAVAIPFDAKGRVCFAPVYIYTIRPERFEEEKLGSLLQGVTAKADIRRIYGNPMHARVHGYEVWYYQIGVYNPFEDEPSGRGH